MSDLVEKVAKAAFLTDWPKDEWERFKPKDYVKDRYRGIARAVVDLVLEEAAKVADGYTPRWIDAEECAVAIRSMKIEQGDG